MKFSVYALFLFILFSSSLVRGETADTSREEAAETNRASYFTDPAGERSAYDETSFIGELVNMLITLGFIIVILIALAWVVRRMQNSRVHYTNESSEIKLVDHRALSAKNIVYLLHIHDRAIILSESQNGVTRIADFSLKEQNDEAPSKDSKSRFERLVNKNPAS